MTNATPVQSSEIIARNFSAMFVAQLVLRFLSLGFNVYAVRVLGEEQLGLYAGALAFVTLFAVLTDLGLNPWAVREIARQRDRTASLIPNLIAIRSIASIILIAVLTLAIGIVSAPALTPTSVFVAALSLLFYAWGGPIGAAFFGWERMDISSMLVIVKQLVYIVCGIVLLELNYGFLGLLAANVASVAAMALASHVVLRRVLQVRFGRISPSKWVGYIKKGLPFGITGATWQLTQQFDTVLMAFLLSAEQVGRYSAPFNLMLMTIVMAQMLGTAVFPSLVREKAAGNDIGPIVERLWRYLMLAALPVAAGGALLADRIILVMYSEEFAGSIQVMRILLLALPMLFSAELFRRLGAVLNKEKRNAQIGFLLMVTSVTLNLLLINALGIIGAAITYLVVRMIELVGLLFISRRLHPLRLLSRLAARLLPPVGAMIAAVWLADRLLAGDAASIVSLVVLILFGAIVFLPAVLVSGGITRGELGWMSQLVRSKVRLQS